jgi:class I lanthipeptide synthase
VSRANRRSWAVAWLAIFSSGKPMEWQPLATGAMADQARRAVEEIVVALRGERHRPSGPSLLDGWAAHALFFDALAEQQPSYEEIADECLGRAIEQLATITTGPQLYGGFTGVAWTAEILGAASSCGDDPNQQVDEVLLRMLGRRPWTARHDLIAGLAGFGVYALERSNRPSGRACLARVVERLDETAERHGRGVTWSHHNHGTAHGVPAIAVVLAGACAVGVETQRAWPLLEGAVRWLLASRLPPGSRSVCVAAALFAVARAVDEPAWAREALAVARTAVRRPLERCDIRDAGLCHGAAGLAHLYNRLWQASGDGELADAARRWYEITLALHEGARSDDTSFLTGATGIGLALLAGLGAAEPIWDRALAASLPP